jgi:hypothetical protein
MTFDETTVFLGFAKGLDYRITIDDLTVSSWFNVLAPELTLDQAIMYAREHYLENDRTMMPAHIAGRYYSSLRSTYAADNTSTEDDCGCISGWEIITENGHAAAQRCTHRK